MGKFEKGKGKGKDGKGKYDKGKGKGKNVKGKGGKGKSWWNSDYESSSSDWSWGSEKGQPDIRKCFKCGKVGHMKKDCPLNRVAGVEDQPEVVGAIFEAVEEDGGEQWVFAVRQVNAVHAKGSMIIDSGAELHVCPPDFHPEVQAEHGLHKEMVTISGDKLPYQGTKKVRTTISDGTTRVPIAADFNVSN